MNTMRDYKHAVRVYLTNGRADGLSDVTLKNYADHLAAYARFCEENDFSPADPAAPMGWKVLLHDAGLKPSTISVYLRDVRCFFSWAVQSPVCRIDANPVVSSTIPKVKRNPYDKLLSEDDILSVMGGKKLDEYRSTPMWPRNHAMAVLLVESAVRASELCAITPADIDWNLNIIHIPNGKGGKSRYVAFPPLAQKAVEDYLDAGIRPSGLDDEEPLFGCVSAQNPEWHGMTRFQVSEIVNRHVRSITGRADIRAHALRHASASAMLMLGVPKEQIQSVLGHSSIQTTERYIGLLRPQAAAVGTADFFSEMERRSVVREVG